MKIVHVRPRKPIVIEIGEDQQLVCCGCGFTHGFNVTLDHFGRIILTMWADWPATRKERARKQSPIEPLHAADKFSS